jgi:ribosome biogenesis GTPase A
LDLDVRQTLIIIYIKTFQSNILNIAVVGYAKVGKSSFINAISSANSRASPPGTETRWSQSLNKLKFYEMPAISSESLPGFVEYSHFTCAKDKSI